MEKYRKPTQMPVLETTKEVELEYTECEDGRIYRVIVPGFHRSELKLDVYDDAQKIVVECKNDTCNKSISFEVPYEIDEVTANLENGILYIEVPEWYEEPYEIEIN
jgi:HSP20 family molecular chaperone IbpA